MLVKDAMARRVETIGPDDTLQAAASKMRALNIGALPVCEDGTVIGMLTDRDIVIRGVADGSSPIEATVRGSMSSNVVYCLEEQPLDEAAILMTEHCIRRIMVFDSSSRLVGFLSLDDLAMKAHGLAIDVIEKCHDPERRSYRGHWQRIG